MEGGGWGISWPLTAAVCATQAPKVEYNVRLLMGHPVYVYYCIPSTYLQINQLSTDRLDNECFKKRMIRIKFFFVCVLPLEDIK